MSARVASDNPLLRPFVSEKLALPNRVVMAPMARGFSPGGVPGEDVARCYRRRAEGGVGLIGGEGTWIPHKAASNDPSVPRFHGADSLDGRAPPAGFRTARMTPHAIGCVAMASGTIVLDGPDKQMLGLADNGAPTLLYGNGFSFPRASAGLTSFNVGGAARHAPGFAPRAG